MSVYDRTTAQYVNLVNGLVISLVNSNDLIKYIDVYGCDNGLMNRYIISTQSGINDKDKIFLNIYFM